MSELAPHTPQLVVPAAPLVLRPYQERDVAATREHFAQGARRVLYVAPTGSGKTVIFAHVVAGATARGNRTFVLVHRDELIQQTTAKLDQIGVAHGVIAAGYSELPLLPVQVCSVMTLVRRLDRLPAPPDFLVIDECQHAVAGTWKKILAAFPQAWLLGVTATPERLDGKGLGDIFDVMVLGPTVEELVAQEYLSKFTTFAPARGPNLSGVRTRAGDFAIDDLAMAMSDGVIIGAAVEEYTRRCAGAPAIVFCVNIEHSELVAARFVEAGNRFAHLDGNTPADERRALIAALGAGELQGITNCGLISEGTDIPAVTAAILLRPTKSLALHLQQVGRALRPAPGKQRALILDHAGNTWTHGLADAPHAWSLAGRPKRKGLAPVRRCFECGAIVPAAVFVCPECGTELRTRELIETDGAALIEADRLVVMSYRQCLRWAGDNERRLRLVAKARGYKRGWVWHRMQEIMSGECDDGSRTSGGVHFARSRCPRDASWDGWHGACARSSAQGADKKPPHV
jgi:superfamily II DNA or RNA helicase